MTKLISLALAVITMAFPSLANAAASCGGPVTNVITYGTGDVMILGSWRGDWTVLCNVNQERLGIKPQTCFTWFSSISTAITENKDLYVYYTTINAPECATMPTYGNAPVPYYVRLAK
ncbi:hypothetical protein GCM10009096_00690 [Parasphingorhabdus litoris]|uniref:Uncharacterized protein n=1 Tax=Parasphingorhabdus litoris TaxID=394733 RepID=A0ABN0ZZR5_9SPHN|nr:hypothetical protein [Parasphingorhabdus litoris]